MNIIPDRHYCPHIRLGELKAYLNGLDLPDDATVHIGPTVYRYGEQAQPTTIGAIGTVSDGGLWIEPYNGATDRMWENPLMWERGAWKVIFAETE